MQSNHSVLSGRGPALGRLVAIALGATAALSAGALTVSLSEATAAPKARVSGAQGDSKPPKVRWQVAPTRTAIAAASSRKKSKKPKKATCRVKAKDPSGVSRVDFYVGNRRVGKDRTAPYTCKFKPNLNKPGRYVMTAKAKDNAGNTATALTVVTVQPEPLDEEPAREANPTPAPTPTPPATTETTGPAEVGIHASLWGMDRGPMGRTIDELRDAGVQYAREDWAWNVVEGTRGEWDWSDYDRLIGESAERGLRIIAVVDGPPRWATPSNRTPPQSGDALAGYTEFLRRSIERYGSEGTFWTENPDLPKVPVTMWDIWNEPYIEWTWGPGLPDGAQYARMFKSVVSAVDEIDPQAKFMLEAETGANGYAWPQPPFLGKMFEAVPDLGEYADIVSIHPYTMEASPNGCSPYSPSKGIKEDWKATRFQFCRVKDVRKILDANGARDARIWITEIGYPTGGSRSISESTQAQWVRDVFKMTRDWRLVDGLVWYHYKTDESDSSEREDYFGLVHADGSPKPAWNAFVDEIDAGLPDSR